MSAKKPVRFEFTWRDPVTGEAIALRVEHTRNYLTEDTDHLEIHAVKPKRAPLPITETGYRSHFVGTLDLINAGNPVTFVTAWLDREARRPEWAKQQTARQQGDLFQWADASAETGNRKSSARAKPPAAKRPAGARPAAKPRKPRARSITQG